jgi:ribosomal protein S3AE
MSHLTWDGWRVTESRLRRMVRKMLAEIDEILELEAQTW